jgi:hypothetical protein
VLTSFTDATTGARKVSMRSNHSRRQRIVNFTGSLDSPLEGDGFEPLVPQREGTRFFETTSIDLRSLHLHGKQLTSSEGPDRFSCDLGMPQGCGEDRRLAAKFLVKKSRVATRHSEYLYPLH